MAERDRLLTEAYISQITSLRNPQGDHICSREQVQTLLNLGADPESLLKLFRYEDDQGTEKFFADSVAFFIRDGRYSVRDLLGVGALVDHLGNPILRSSNEFWDFAKIEGSIGSAQAIGQIYDSEGFTVYRHDRLIGFNGFESITYVLKHGGTPEAIQQLVDLRNDDDISVFRTPRDINRFIESEGTLKYAQAMLDLRDHEHRHIFNEFTIALFKEYSGRIAYAQRLAALHDTEGQVIFSNGEDIVNFLDKERSWSRKKKVQRPIEIAEKVIGITDNEGKTVFRDGSNVVSVLRATDDNIDDIYPFVQITDSKENTYFNGEEIALLMEHKVPVEYASALAKQGLNPATIMYYFKMELSEDQTDFSDSGKPKSLIIYPTDDSEDILGQAFRDEDTFTMLKKLAGTYDVKLRAVSSVEEMIKEIDEIDDAHFLIFAGHGTPRSITYGKPSSKYGRNTGSHKFTTDHIQIKDHLARLCSLEYIWSDSCLTGQGGEEAENMVNFLAECAPGVMVAGPTAVTNARLTEIGDTYPPNLRFKEIYSYKDCTYTHKVEQ